jgi:hypothetical protein
MKRFSNFLFEVDESKTLTERVPVAAAPAAPSAPVVPPINMKPYLAERVLAAVPKGNHGRWWQEKDLMKLSDETLEMMLALPRLHELDNQFLERNAEEGRLRSILLLVGSERFAASAVTRVEYSYQTVSNYHALGFTDLSRQDPVTIDRITAAVEVVDQLGASRLTPPQLTYFAMKHPDKVDDIVAYVKEHYSDSSTIHLIDMERLNGYVNTEHKALRDGLL